MRRTAIAIASILCVGGGDAPVHAAAPEDFGAAITQPRNAPRAVKIARTRAIPACTRFVDAAAAAGGTGTVARPFKTIAAAIAAAPAAAIICVAQGTYPEQLRPGTKFFTLAGGFQRNKDFKVRDSALYVSRARGNDTGSFIRIEDPGPTGTQLTAIDGFDISGYSQAVYRDIYYSQRFDLTNNNIHDNTCADSSLTGAGFALGNVTGAIRGNVIARNSCNRGGAGALNDSLNANTVSITRNLVKENSGTEPGISHGGGLYLFANKLTITANDFIGNTVTGWGAGLYVGAYTGGGQFTDATLAWNVYRSNRAGIAGGGFFCDDSARCVSDHEIYDRNCGGNIYFDSGESDPTVGSFNHLTNFGARTVGCGAPGAGVQIDKGSSARDTYTFKNALFWGNATNRDFAVGCSTACANTSIRVTYSMVQRRYANNGGVAITFGAGVLAPVNPRFVNATNGDFHLKSRFGHWTPTGYVRDTVSSPALAKGTGPVPLNPPRAGTRSELGAFGNSDEASYVR